MEKAAPKLSTRADATVFSPPPRRFTPPSTKAPLRDRNPRAGYTGELTFGEVAAGSGSFIRYARALGMECVWFSEKDKDLHPAAQREAGPQARSFGSLLSLHPHDVPEVFMLLGGPECQPFSRAGARKELYDMRARTLLWIIWCLSVRQFPGAFVENVAELLFVKQGKVWGALMAVIEGIGYTATVAEDNPTLVSDLEKLQTQK